MAACIRSLLVHTHLLAKPRIECIYSRVATFPIVKRTYSSTFLTNVTAEQLWKGVTSVSNAGRKKGRGKGSGRKIIKDLNRGQRIGVGKKNMVFPGLNAPVFRGKEIVERIQLPEDENYMERLVKIRDEMGGFRRLKLQPLERGYSGNKMAGRKIGPPDPVGEDTFEDFESIALEVKIVCTMTGNMGRRRRYSVLAVTGNRNGLAGFALVKLPDSRSAVKKGKNRAAQRLRFIERFEEHTVCHDFYSRFGQTRLFVKKRPKGYGLVCHRVIRSMCEVIGISDIYVKVEGAMNVLSITKAFFVGLQKQRTPEQLALEKGLHLVEFRDETDNFPHVIASPAKCRTKDEIEPDEELDYDLYLSEGKVELPRRKPPPFFTLLPSWQNYLKKTEIYRNHKFVKRQLALRYGKVDSFLHIKERQKQKQNVNAAVEEEEFASKVV